VKIAIVFGTRPEAIKLAPVILEARRRPQVLPLIISTGQHREMLAAVLNLFSITPDLDLQLMRPNQSLAEISARALTSMTEVLTAHRPDLLVVQGDTTTAMASALAAFYLHIPVAHVEAGLRTDCPTAPFPEEINRRVISQVAHWHFAPTEQARAYLERDGMMTLGGRILVTGNTVIDALYLAVAAVKASPPVQPDLQAAIEWKRDPAHRLILITGHRRESFGRPFEEFCLGLRDIAEAHPWAMLVYPVHLNPNVQEPVRRILGKTPNIRLAPVLDYPAFVALMQTSDFIITDSGGVQEEAPALGKPVLVTRDVTERPEAVHAGGVRLVGPHRQPLFASAHELLTSKQLYEAMAQRQSPYGDGHAAPRILDALLHRD
jgi:UDP-N-acetylglucosamine 2-epimerase (non-hydrolysing)